VCRRARHPAGALSGIATIATGLEGFGAEQQSAAE
jgi:hypothetical protein